MANLNISEVAALFNCVWSEPGSTKIVAGMTLHAQDAPNKIMRYSSMTEMELIWSVNFTFNAHGNHHKLGTTAVKLLQYPGNVHFTNSNAVLYIGDLTVTKIRGDLDRFMKDFTLLKMFKDEWMSE